MQILYKYMCICILSIQVFLLFITVFNVLSYIVKLYIILVYYQFYLLCSNKDYYYYCIESVYLDNYWYYGSTSTFI